MSLLVVLIGFQIGYAQQKQDVSWNEPRPQDSAFYAKIEQIAEPTFGFIVVR